MTPFNSLKLSSKTKVQELQANPKGKYRVHDSDQSELCILVYPSGKKSWEFYKKIKGTNKIQENVLGSFPILTYEKAKEEVQRRLLKLATAALNPEANFTSKLDPNTTLAEWVNNVYFPQYCCNLSKKTNQKNRGMFKNQLSSLHDRPIFSIQKAELIQLHKQIKDSGLSPQTANRVIAMLKAIYNILINEDLAPDTFKNPAKIKLDPEEARHVFITPEHLPYLIDELEKWKRNDGFKNFVKLSLYSGLRENELLQLKWSDVEKVDLTTLDLTPDDVIHIKEPKAYAKIGSRDFAISQEFKNVLIQMAAEQHTPDDYLFPNCKKDDKKSTKKGKKNTKKKKKLVSHVRNYTHTWITFLEHLKARLRQEGIEYYDPSDEEPIEYVEYIVNGKTLKRKKRKNHMYRIHDLRRSVGAYMVKAGRSCEQIAKVLGNTPAVVQKTYSPMLKEDQQVYLESGMAELTDAMKMK